MASVANQNILKFDKDALLKQANNISSSLRLLKIIQVINPNTLTGNVSIAPGILSTNTFSTPSTKNTPLSDASSSKSLPIIYSISSVSDMSSPGSNITNTLGVSSGNTPAIMGNNLQNAKSRIIFIDSDNNKTMLEDVEQNFHPITGEPEAK